MKIAKLIVVLGGVSLLTGCGPGRKAQCDTLAQAQNQVRNTIMAQHQTRIGQPSYAQSHELQMMQVMQQSAQTMQAVELKDKTLQELQARLVASYQNSSTIYQNTANLLPAAGSPSEAAMQQVDTLHRQVDAGIPEAIHDFNLYCMGG
ncbi:MAG: hypothetical protein F6J87_12660 [Spirulina sp. SIO3F2]|nr:hypothetical protein [Spirulina sp. SIO3F2]